MVVSAECQIYMQIWKLGESVVSLVWIITEQLLCDAFALPSPALFPELIKAHPTYATTMDLLVHYTQ